MSDLIDRQALLKQIDIDSDGEPGYYGDTWKFIDTIKNMPNVHDLPKDTDTISRAKAIDVIDSFNVFESRSDQIKLEQMIGELPPTQPERIKGRWIYHPEWANDGECGYECSVCHMGSDIDYNFCMRCGADMREATT